jgi:L-ribulose-5-phosphate 3-epimerase
MIPGQAAYTVNTYSYTARYSALACLEHLSDLGFSAFELMLIPGHFWPSLATAADRRAIGSLLAARGLRIETLNQPNLDINLAALSPECRDYSCAVVVSAMEVAAEWGAQGVVVNPGKSNPVFSPGSDLLADRFRSSLDILVGRAGKLGVQLIIKNHPLSWLCKGKDLVAFFSNYGWDHVGVGYDVANAVYGRESVVDTLPRLAGHLSALYAADTPLDEFRHNPAGDGAVPFASIAKALAAVGYGGPTILEIVSPEPDAALLHTVSELHQAFWPSIKCRQESARNKPGD